MLGCAETVPSAGSSQLVGDAVVTLIEQDQVEEVSLAGPGASGSQRHLGADRCS